MSRYSIYQKPCPACGVLVSTETKLCDCGYSFESSAEDVLLPEEQVLQEEELFEAYLEARVGQIVAMVESARADFAADPVNPHKAEHLLEAVQEALTLRDEREAQAAKIAQARETVQAAREKLDHTTSDAPVMSAQATDAFKAHQAAKAEKIVEAFVDTQTKKCPHCKTVLPVTSALCLCGYIFARDDFLLPRAVDVNLPEGVFQPK
jgi:AcrR family transcriptional regulator